MLKFLTPLVIIAGSLAYVAYRAQQAANQAVPTAEHKKQWWQKVQAEDQRRREALSA